MTGNPTSPAGLKASGRKLWRSVVDDFDLGGHELLLLREACRAADVLDALQTIVDAEGVLDVSPQGRRAHPAVVELRQQRLVFARLVAQLGIPADEDNTDAVGRSRQRRAVRGVYGITGAVQ